MPTLPRVVTLTNSSIDVLNVIRNNASQNYQDYVPVATANAESIREIGAVIMDYPTLQNEFLSHLMNRIGKVIITSKTYDNPLKMFKKGFLEYGETIEEIFVNIAKPHIYDVERAESEVFKREIPDVKSAFHIMNFKTFYKATVEQEQLKTAFLSIEGVTDLITRIIDSMYTASNYDEFQVMKYLIVRNILNGRMYPVTIPVLTGDNEKAVVKKIKGVSNALEFMSDKYNVARVKTHTVKKDQYIIVDSNFDAGMDVEVLASAFNIDKAQFIGQRVLIDDFGTIDNDRLAVLFAGEGTYKELTDEEMLALRTIPAVIVDKEFFMIFDNKANFEEQKNGEGMYWNYWYHIWKTFSTSPFANTTVFVQGTPSVTSVTVSPETATVSAGNRLQLSAVVDTEYFAPQIVNWTIESGTGATVNNSGLVVLSDTATGTIVARATSVYDALKFDECTITVG